MRYELVADTHVEAEILASHPAARTLFDPFLPVLQARALMAAVRLGVFAAMGLKAYTNEEIASALALNPEALALLLKVLVCAGYLTYDGQMFSLTELARVSVHSESPQQLVAWVEHNYTHWKIINRLEDVLQTGEGIDSHTNLGGHKEWAVYQQAMLETARPVAPWVAARVLVPDGAVRLLDIGGSHGLYGAAICRAHPPLRSEVLELPLAVESARRLAQAEGIDDVVTHRAGDVRVTDLGQEVVDVVFLGNLVHHFSVVENQALFRRIASALRPGGTVAIWDFEMPVTGSPPDLVADGLALFFRIGSSTRCYTTDELVTWLAVAGFTDIRVQPAPPPAHLLLMGCVT